MANIKLISAVDLRAKNTSDLLKHIADLKADINEQIFDKRTKETKNPHRLRASKKQLALSLTILRERELAESSVKGKK